ncbi:hypothetical protein [Hyalangium versicolor]|nr:hypothetical protein [Hyalangium versicolor]
MVEEEDGEEEDFVGGAAGGAALTGAESPKDSRNRELHLMI